MDDLTHHDVRRIAVEAVCDPRTIERYLRGERLGSHTMRQRIEKALRALGLDSLLRTDPIRVRPVAGGAMGARITAGARSGR